MGGASRDVEGPRHTTGAVCAEAQYARSGARLSTVGRSALCAGGFGAWTVGTCVEATVGRTVTRSLDGWSDGSNNQLSAGRAAGQLGREEGEGQMTLGPA